MSMADEYQRYVGSGDEVTFPSCDKSDESLETKSPSEEPEELPGGLEPKDAASAQGEYDDIGLESEVDLGEGDIDFTGYPTPENEQEYQEFLKIYRRDPEQQALYAHVLEKSHRFEVPFILDNKRRCKFRPERYHNLRTRKAIDEFVGYCKQAIDEYNQRKGTRFIFKYLIKMTHDVVCEFNITFALTDPKRQPYVGRLKVLSFPHRIEPLKITRGELGRMLMVRNIYVR